MPPALTLMTELVVGSGWTILWGQKQLSRALILVPHHFLQFGGKDRSRRHQNQRMNPVLEGS